MAICIAEPTKYLCSKDTDSLYVTFNTKEQKVIVGSTNPKKYWTEANSIFWLSAHNITVNEFTFQNSYNQLVGKLNIKSHNLVTSENRWLNYDCKVSQ